MNRYLKIVHFKIIPHVPALISIPHYLFIIQPSCGTFVSSSAEPRKSLSEMSEIPLVLVTGVTGYIGTWVAYAALKLGYRVRGTVRSLSSSQESKVRHLRDTSFCPEANFTMELVEADLNSERGWNEAVAGCTYIL